MKTKYLPAATPAAPAVASAARRLSRALRTGGLLVVAIVSGTVLLSSAAGCEGKTCEEQGGIVVDGKCEGKCDSSKCLAGNVCSNNRCVLVCDSHLDCLEAQSCSSVKADDGTDIMACVATQKSQWTGAACPNTDECAALSACPDGSECTGVAEDACKPEECRPMACLGAGVGDAYAYCTTLDCQTSADCAAGMECRVRRTPQKICGTQKGTEDPCVDPASFTLAGATYQEGPVSLLQNVCAKREHCSPCETELDCDYGADLSCVNINGQNHCAKSCAVAKDCEDDAACTDGFCIPKFGACTGNGNFCEPCNTDLDCAAGGPTMACYALQGTQTACIDAAFSTTCTTDNDCPTSPSGKHGHCLTAQEGGAELANRCFAPLQASTSKFKCW